MVQITTVDEQGNVSRSTYIPATRYTPLTDLKKYFQGLTKEERVKYRQAYVNIRTLFEDELWDLLKAEYLGAVAMEPNKSTTEAVFFQNVGLLFSQVEQKEGINEGQVV